MRDECPCLPVTVSSHRARAAPGGGHGFVTVDIEPDVLERQRDVALLGHLDQVSACAGAWLTDLSSSPVNSTLTVAPSSTPTLLSARSALSRITTPPFMSETPWPRIRGRRAPGATGLEGSNTLAMCPSSSSACRACPRAAPPGGGARHLRRHVDPAGGEAQLVELGAKDAPHALDALNIECAAADVDRPLQQRQRRRRARLDGLHDAGLDRRELGVRRGDNQREQEAERGQPARRTFMSRISALVLACCPVGPSNGLVT